MIPHLSVPELLIIGALALIFFGSNKLPETARSFGKALKGFKEELKDVTESTKLDPVVEKVAVVEIEDSAK
jgi:TatA/E family protein of Tat protein translocase